MDNKTRKHSVLTIFVAASLGVCLVGAYQVKQELRAYRERVCTLKRYTESVVFQRLERLYGAEVAARKAGEIWRDKDLSCGPSPG